MSTLKLSHIEKTIYDMNATHWLRILLDKKQMSMALVSKSIGKNKNYLNSKKRKRQFTSADLMILSMYLDTNLFEWYSDRLPEHIRFTKKEEELRQQLGDLQKQLDAVSKERDWMKEALLRR